MCQLPPRIDNRNKARKIFDTLLAQREDMIESIRFTILQKAVLLDRTSQDEVNAYNDLYKSYLDLIHPTKKITEKESKDLMKGWEKFMRDGFEVKKAAEPEIAKLPPLIIKNLSKIT